MDAKRAALVMEALEKLYPEARPELNFRNPFETLIATILSAQCTDKRVNLVTARLFPMYLLLQPLHRYPPLPRLFWQYLPSLRPFWPCLPSPPCFPVL